MTGRRAATRYARALFDVVVKDGDPRRADRELAEFSGLVQGHPALAHVLGNPAVPAPRKRALVEALVARIGTLSPPVGKLLRLLAERDRLSLLPWLVEAYHDRLLQHLRIVRAEVVSATPLPADRLGTIESSLARATGRQVSLSTRVDPALIGGVVARIGSLVFDASVTRQLEKLRARLIENP